MRDLPAAVREKARAAGASSWPAALPSLVDDLTARWSLELGPAFGDATEAYVAPATRADGTPAVLKLLVPRHGDAATHEITVLRRAGGRGCARLLASDAALGALLLERLGPAMSTLSLEQPHRLTILCDLAAALWQQSPNAPRPRLAAGPAPDAAAAVEAAGVAEPPPGSASPVAAASSGTPSLGGASRAADGDPSHGLPTGAEKASWLSAYVLRAWSELGEPCTRRTVDQAVAAAESRRRAHDPSRAVVVHGDIHQWNALLTASHHEGALEALSAADFRLVDPDGLFAEPEYDLGVLMREDPVELLSGDPWDRAAGLAARTGTDPQAIWEWGLVERVSTGLILTAIGLQPVAQHMLTAADHISAA